MAQHQHTPPLFSLEEAVTVLLCLIDDAYRLLNPNWRSYEPLKKLSDSEVLTLALLQQLRAMESERSFLRDAGRFFSHLFPGVVGLHPSSLHRRVRKLKLRSYLEPLRRAVVTDLLGDPETLIIDSTLLAVLHPRQVHPYRGESEVLVEHSSTNTSRSASSARQTSALQAVLRNSSRSLAARLRFFGRTPACAKAS